MVSGSLIGSKTVVTLGSGADRKAETVNRPGCLVGFSWALSYLEGNEGALDPDASQRFPKIKILGFDPSSTLCGCGEHPTSSSHSEIVGETEMPTAAYRFILMKVAVDGGPQRQLSASHGRIHLGGVPSPASQDSLPLFCLPGTVDWT